MTGVAQVLDDVLHTLGAPTESVPPSGLFIDEVVGGLHRGGLWRIQGPSESGRTTLALQVARTAAQAGLATILFAPVHEPRNIIARLLAGMVPLVPLTNILGGLTDEHGDIARFESNVATLRQAPLEIYTEPAAEASAWDQLVRPALAPPARVIVVDDHDLLALWSYDRFDGAPGGGFDRSDPQSLRELARAWQATIVVTTATSGCGWKADWSPEPIPAPWARHADVAIELDRPDQRGLPERAGDIDLHILRNRYGPKTTITLRFQGHFARVVPTIGTRTL